MAAGQGLVERVECARDGLYIKQGRGGAWAQHSFDAGIIQLGFGQVPFDECPQPGPAPEIWDALTSRLVELARSAGVKQPTRDVGQVRLFYEASESTIWFTFHARKLYWCFSSLAIERATAQSMASTGATRFRRVDGTWSDKALDNSDLWIAAITGRLTKNSRNPRTLNLLTGQDVRRLKDKILGKPSSEAVAVLKGRQQLVRTLTEAIGTLNENDFEILADLVLSRAGLRRSTAIGGDQPTIDFEGTALFSESLIHVQVKAGGLPETATKATVLLERLASLTANGGRAILVGNVDEHQWGDTAPVQLVGRRNLAEYCVEYGLVDWVVQKAG